MHQSALQRKLKDLVDCVLAKVEEDSSFAEQLAQILLTDAARDRLGKKGKHKKAGDIFNPVLFHKEHGEQELYRQLESKTDDDLRAIARMQGLRKGKELKTLEREQLLIEIVDGAKAKLKQGKTVAGVESSDRADSGAGTKSETTDAKSTSEGHS